MTKSHQFEDALVSFALDYPAFLDDDAALALAPGDFANGNGEVWAALRTAHADGGVNVAKIAAGLGQGFDLQYFSAIKSRYVGTSWAAAQDMARSLKQHSARMQLRTIATVMVNDAAKPDRDALTVASEAMERLIALSRDSAGEPEAVGDALAGVREYIEERAANPGEVWGIPYGLPRLDRFTGGAHPGELAMLAGEPGVGKSFLSAQFALSFGQSRPGVVFSLEMSTQAMILRMMGLLGVDTWRVRTGYITEADRDAIAAAEKTIAGRGIFIHDGILSLAAIRAKLTGLKAKHRIGWFILDYVGLVDERAESDIEKTARISGALKGMCRSLDVSGLALSSVNKSGMDTSAANKGAMSGSGRQIHDADNVFFLTAIDENPGRVNLTCKKGRDIPNSTNRKMELRKPTGGQPFTELETTMRDLNKEQS
jgi:replicative DNA helicase